MIEHDVEINCHFLLLIQKTIIWIVLSFSLFMNHMVYFFSFNENFRVLWPCSEHLRDNFLRLHYLVLYFCPPSSLFYNLWIKHTTTTVWPSIFLSPFSPDEFPTFQALLPPVLQFWAVLFKGDFCPTRAILHLWLLYGTMPGYKCCSSEGQFSSGGASLWFLNDSSLCLFPTNFSQLMLALVYHLLLAFSCYLW